jgi:hypothetical protein
MPTDGVNFVLHLLDQFEIKRFQNVPKRLRVYVVRGISELEEVIKDGLAHAGYFSAALTSRRLEFIGKLSSDVGDASRL